MFPELHFVVGGTHVTVALHALCVVLAVAAATGLIAWRTPDALPAALACTFAALLGARIWYRLFRGGPVDFWSGGLASTGGIIAVAGAIFLAARLARHPPLALFDALAPPGILALGIGRVGCFLGGCCYGRPTTLPWGVIFPDLGPPARHPLQLYSAVADVTLAAFLPAAGPTGTTTRAAALGLGLVRAGLETLRDPSATDYVPGTAIPLPQAAALLLAFGALVVPYIRRGLRARSNIDYGSAAKERIAWRMRKR